MGPAANNKWPLGAAHSVLHSLVPVVPSAGSADACCHPSAAPTSIPPRVHLSPPPAFPQDFLQICHLLSIFFKPQLLVININSVHIF